MAESELIQKEIHSKLIRQGKQNEVLVKKLTELQEAWKKKYDQDTFNMRD